MIEVFDANGTKKELLENKDLLNQNNNSLIFINGIAIVFGTTNLGTGYAQEVYLNGISFSVPPHVVISTIGQEKVFITNIYENRFYCQTDADARISWIAIGIV